MNAIRRAYLYLAAAISLQATAWAAIGLLRRVAGSDHVFTPSAFSWPLAVVVVTVVIYLLHWVAAERLARGSDEERRALIRGLFVHGMAAGFLAPWVVNAVTFLAGLTASLTGIASHDGRSVATTLDQVLRWNLPALIVLGLLWAYHLLVMRSDAAVAAPSGDVAALRRLYRLGFALAGWLMALYSAVHILRWVMLKLPVGSGVGLEGPQDLPREIARLAVGAGLWALAWRAAERERATGAPDEARSALRYTYLYAVVGNAVVATVVNGGLLLTGVFRNFLALPPRGDVRGPLPVVLVLGAVWVLYGRLIAGEVAAAPASSLQASVRRIYNYLVAAAGLGSLLVGTSMLLSKVLPAVAGVPWNAPDQEAVAWSAAATLMGLAVWSSTWRAVQAAADDDSPLGHQEREAISRKFYAYAALLATVLMTLLGGVNLLQQLLDRLLGGSGTAVGGVDLELALAVVLVGAAGWGYHALVLRQDGRRDVDWQKRRQEELRALVIDGGDGAFGRSLLAALKRDLPHLAPTPLGLTAAAAAAMGAPSGEGVEPSDLIAGAGLIVGPWEISRQDGLGGAVSAEVANAMAAATGTKLLVPDGASGYQWAGLDPWTPDGQVAQTVNAVRQLVAGEEVRAVRPVLTLGGVLTALVVIALVVFSISIFGNLMSGGY